MGTGNYDAFPLEFPRRVDEHEHVMRIVRAHWPRAQSNVAPASPERSGGGLRGGAPETEGRPA